MADDTTGAETAPQTNIIERTSSGDGPISLRDAANSLVDARRKDNAKERTEQPGEARTDATAQESASQEADTPPPQEVTGETQEAEPAEPAIEPPRSWNKDAREHWNKLDPATQEYIATRDREDQAAIKRSLNEAAEKSKGLTAKEQAAEQVRTQYEQALPMLLQALQQQHAGTFADIKSIADVERMAAEDWPRYVQWDAQQKKVAAVQQEVQATQQRQAQEKQTKLATYIQDQNALFAEKAPELSDPKVKAATQEAAVAMFKELGFSDGELADLWHGKSEISLHDHRLQLLIRDGVKYRTAQTAAKKAAVKTVPQVQRPGPARAPNADADERVRNLETRLASSGSLRDAAALLTAQRAARR